MGDRGGFPLPVKIFASPEKMCWTWFKTNRHSFKNLGPLRKLCPAWCPKLVTGLD